MTERRNTMEFFRHAAADLFEAHTGSAWRPRAGSKVNHRALTAAMMDAGEVLDKVLAKHRDMVLLHGGSPKGAEFIAARWADTRKVRQVVFKPDWTRHAEAAPFKRNDQLLKAMPYRRGDLSGLPHHRQPRRQGEGVGDPGVAVRRRRVSAAFEEFGRIRPSRRPGRERFRGGKHCWSTGIRLPRH
jgi:hypothetical protein